MHVEQKSYAQIIIVTQADFIFSSTYKEYERMCPFLCFPGMFARDFRCSVKEPGKLELNKDVILLLEPYWKLLPSEEQKSILDHELGHIASGHLKAIEEKVSRGERLHAEVNEADEKQADAYSVDLNGSKAMHNGLMKALDVIVKGYRDKGHRITVSQVIENDPILKRRLKVMEEQSKQ